MLHRIALACLAFVGTPAPDDLTAELRELVASARSHALHAGDAIWPGYSAAPFGLLLTLEHGETLLCHGSKADGFSALPMDAATQCDTQFRPSVFPRNLLAAMPVVGGVSTIVVGTPEATNKTPADWTRTLFHEHFHQYQSTFPDYYARLAALDLAGGDETGMWMLNYPFPFDDRGFTTALQQVAASLQAAVRSDPDQIGPLASVYLERRAALEAAVPARDWRYLEMQLWVEGVARWTEIELAKASPDPALAASGKREADRTIEQLTTLDPQAARRVIAYPLGAAEAMLLERCMQDWRSAYAGTLSLGTLVKQIRPEDCR